MVDEVIVHTDPDPDPDAATPEEVAAVVREAIHDEHVRDAIEELKDGREEWQATLQMEITSLSERLAGVETTLSGLMAVTQAVAEEVEEVGEVVEEMMVEEEHSEEIVLPPEPEPEPQEKKQEGFSPLRRILG